jgi:hypothetical protein
VFQVAEYLLSKHKALSSNPEPPKKKKERKLWVQSDEHGHTALIKRLCSDLSK